MDNSRLGQTLMGFSMVAQKDLSERTSTILALVKQGNLNWLHSFLNEQDINFKDRHNKNLLFYACFHNQPSVVVYLLSRGVQINNLDSDNKNLFHVCGYTGHLSCLDVILTQLMLMRNTETITEFRKLLAKHEIKKSDYRNGELHEPATANKTQRFKLFQQDVTKLLQNHYKIELEDYTIALSTQQTASKRTPIHLASLNRYQKCYQTLKVMLRQETSENSFQNYMQYWNETETILKRNVPDPRQYHDILNEVESGIKQNQVEQLKNKYSNLFDKEIEKILMLEDKDSKTALHLASENGHASIVQLLIKVGADPKQINSSSKNQKVIQVALNDPTRKQITNLCKASSAGDKNEINLLINCGQQVNQRQTIFGVTPLITSVVYSSQSSNLEPVALLLESGANINMQDVNGWTSLHKACQKGNVELVELLLSNRANANICSNKGYTPLHIAAMNNQEKVVQILLSKVKNIDVDKGDQQGCTPLHLAAKKGANKALVKLLNHPECNLYSVDMKKWTALHYATFSQHKDTVRILLKYDVEGNKLRAMKNCQGKIARELSNNGVIRNAYSNLWTAASEGKLDEIRRLLLEGDDKDETSIKDKKTPLMYAVINGHSLVVKFLLDKGADTYAQDANGKTTQNYATKLVESAGTDKTKKAEATKILKMLQG